VEATVGQKKWAAIWRGADNAVRLAMIDEFGSSNCSAWALRKRKPHGDLRPRIKKITGIDIEAWSKSAEAHQ